MTAIMNVDARYCIEYEYTGNRWIAFLDNKSLMSFLSKEDAQAYCVTHNRLHNSVGE